MMNYTISRKKKDLLKILYLVIMRGSHGCFNMFNDLSLLTISLRKSKILEYFFIYFMLKSRPIAYLDTNLATSRVHPDGVS